MAMNNVSSTATSNVERPNQITSTSNTTVSVDSSSPFQPRTEVTIENSVQNMLNALTKAILNNGDLKQAMPEELQKLMNQILQNSFSLNESLGQGLLNAMQSQKVCIEQLTILAKLISQLGTEISQNSVAKLPEAVQTFLTHLSTGNTGNEEIPINVTNLNKIALQLLDGKQISDLPEALQLLLMQTISGGQTTAIQSPETDILKQLIKFFMPSSQPSTEETATNENKQPTGNQPSASQESLAKNDKNTTVPQNTNQENTSSMNKQPPANNANAPKSSLNAEPNDLVPQPQEKASDGQSTKQNTNDMVKNEQKSAMPSQTTPMQINLKEAQTLIKSLSAQLLNSKSLSEEEVSLLKNFINDKQEVLSEKDMTTLKTLLNMAEENIPFSIRQAAVKQNLPELPKLWAFVQLTNLTRLLDLNENRLKNAGKDIQDFSNLLKKSFQPENEASGNQRSMSFMTPIYLGDNEHRYPAYIHIYHQEAEKKENKQQESETWLRICLVTENVGAVEVVFRLYEGEKLNLRLAFSNKACVNSFNEFLPDLETAFQELPFILTDVKVTEIGER